MMPAWFTACSACMVKVCSAAVKEHKKLQVTFMWRWCSTDSPVGKSLLLIIRAFFIDLSTVGDAT